MYVRASSRESLTPTSAMWWFMGTHGIPPETPVVPPMRSAFSSSSTSAPPSYARVAAVSPAAPEPITTTSTTRSHLPGAFTIISVPPGAWFGFGVAQPGMCWFSDAKT